MTVTLQSLQVVTRWHSQKVQRCSRVQLGQLTLSDPLEGLETSDSITRPRASQSPCSESSESSSTVYRVSIYGKFVPVATRFADFLRDLLLGASNISGNETFTPDTSTVIGWLEASPDARQWAQAQIERSDLGIEGLEIVDGFGGKCVRFSHHGLDAPVVLGYESKGTRQLVHLLPMIKYALEVTGLAILDEVDGAHHVDMLGEILNQFRSRETNPRGAQLLVSSHHVGLLDHLEKEEVFIVEKDHGGATRVHGAQDVQGLRRDVRLYPKYRSGILGGLPRIG